MSCRSIFAAGVNHEPWRNALGSGILLRHGKSPAPKFRLDSRAPFWGPNDVVKLLAALSWPPFSALFRAQLDSKTAPADQRSVDDGHQLQVVNGSFILIAVDENQDLSTVVGKSSQLCRGEVPVGSFSSSKFLH